MKSLFLALILFCFCQSVQAADDLFIPENDDRIIFIGDSITAQGQLHNGGWGSFVREALEAVGNKKSNAVLLGGSGHTIGSWANVEKNSRKEDVYLDSKKLNIGKEIDRGAKVLVIMLGMNDVLGPYLDGTQNSVDDWGQRYLALVDSFQKRVKARQVCMATVTMCTEDLNSYKNILVQKLNKKIYEMAAKHGYGVATTFERYKEAFKRGRENRYNFHIMGDYVHPNHDGHISIAVGMLEGLGKVKEAEYLKKKYYNEIGSKASGGKPEISYEVFRELTSTVAEKQSYKIHYYVKNTKSSPAVKIGLPEGWESDQKTLQGDKGVFHVSGIPDRLLNELTLTVESMKKVINIPAPWIIAWGVKQPNWGQGKFPIEPKVYETDIDRAFSSGKKVSKINPENWQVYQPSLNYTGGENPGSVDFAAVTVCRPFDAGYGVRRVFSSKDRQVTLKASSHIFAGNIFLTAWVNGQSVYQDELTSKPGKKDQVEVSLKKGWNVIGFKSNRIAWQWQQALELIPLDGDSLEDLRYSIIEK